MQNSTLLHERVYYPQNNVSVMGRKLLPVMMLLLAITGYVRAQELTVHDGTSTSSYVPFFGLWVDDYTRSEMIYPAEELTSMVGGNINSLTFYKSSNNTNTWGAASFQIYMKEVTETILSEYIGMTDATVVYEGGVDATGGEIQLTINFITPYHYNGGNLLLGIYEVTTGSYSSAYWYGENVTGASASGHNSSDPVNANFSQRNFLPKTTFTFAPGSGIVNQLFAVQNGEVVDTISVGARPNGYWMRPFTFQIRNGGATTTLSVIDFIAQNYFTLVGPELPVQMAYNQEIDVQLTTDTSTNTEYQMVAIYGTGRTACLWNIKAEPYDPVTPDVWELAEEVSGFPFTNTVNSNSIPIYDNYRLPPTNIPDGADAVYKLVFTEDTYLNASVTSGENGKVALYTEDFNGAGGPDLENNYTRPQLGDSNIPFIAMIGEGTSTTGYFPFYTLYNYSISENLFLASELEAAGVTTTPMTSLSWYATNAPGFEQQGITIWMANVNDETLTTTSHIVTDMIKVYTGAVTPTIGWNEFVFNEDFFAWDGHSNILIYCQRNNGQWNSTVQWQATSGLPFNAMAYRYQDIGAYDPTIANMMYTSTTRPNIIMKSTGNDRDSGNGSNSNGDISELTVTPGTYYLVASSTSDEFTVEIHTDEVPCPELATNPYPADATTEVNTSVLLSWELDSRATEFRLMFGTTYYCEDTLVDWTGLIDRFYVTGLNNNTNYFWRIDQRNGDCPEGVLGQVWGFTTHLNEPQNLYADDFILEGDELTLSWDAPSDRSLLYYKIYQDSLFIGSTSYTSYIIGNLPYNINPGYNFNVTAVYDEGESHFSDTRWVRVTGEGTVEGYVYEQDNVTPIQGALVEFNGSGQIGGSYSYQYYTDENGHYSFNMVTGTYNGTATCIGYQGAQHGSFTIAYNELTSDINFVMDEIFSPVAQVVAEYYPDANDPNSPYVKLYWAVDRSIEDIATGEFNMFDRQLKGIDSWSVTTTDPNEGTFGESGKFAGNNRAISYYRVYRTNCDNEGPYTEENTILLASQLHDNIYIDASWQDAAPGAYKWGVGVVYVGNRGEEIAGPINWSESVNVNRATSDYNFDDNTMQGWTNIDADGDGNVWVSSSNPGIYHNSGVNLSGTGHNFSEAYVISCSYASQIGAALFPDNYLVSPQVALGGSISFYACAQDAVYAAEHFGVAVSTTSNTNASAFTTIQEWTMTAKGGDGGVRSFGREGSNRAQGNWYQFTVDLSAYSGMGYVAIRHFNSYDQFILNIDDITIDGNPIQEPRESEIVWSNCLEKHPSIQLVAGWNWFSTNVEITLDDLKAALIEALPNATSITIKGKNAATTYNGTTWRGQLNTLDVTQMYKIETPTDCVITLEGLPINPAEHPVTITANAANWIAFPLSESMSLNNAFAGFAFSGDQIKGKSAAATYNGTNWRGNLNTFVPGQGYIYKSNVQEDRTFIFPANTK